MGSVRGCSTSNFYLLLGAPPFRHFKVSHISRFYNFYISHFAFTFHRPGPGHFGSNGRSNFTLTKSMIIPYPNNNICTNRSRTTNIPSAITFTTYFLCP